MNHIRISIGLLCLFLFAAAQPTLGQRKKDPLSLWEDTPQKAAILEFVAAVADRSSDDFVPVADRIAVFDFDGTVGCEKPTYMEVALAMQQLCQTAQAQPALQRNPLYDAACREDLDYIDDTVYSALLLAFEHYPEAAYQDSVEQFLTTELHPRFQRPYSELTYAPMVQLINYLRRKRFSVWLCSGSQQGFVGTFGTQHLEFQSWEVIGSTVELRYDTLASGDVALTREDAFGSPSPDGEGKVLLIQNRIGKAPILAFGNSMGDFEMLVYTQSNAYRNLELILVHDDAEEYEYSNTSLESEAQARDWLQVGMKANFRTVFGEE